MRPVAAALGFLENGLVGERGEGRGQECTPGGFENPGIAVVDGAVMNDLRPRPSLPVVGGGHQFHTPKGTDVILPASRTDQKQLPVPSLGEGAPSMIAMGQVTDGVNGGEVFRTSGFGAGLDRATGQGHGALNEKVASRGDRSRVHAVN